MTHQVLDAKVSKPFSPRLFVRGILGLFALLLFLGVYVLRFSGSEDLVGNWKGAVYAPTLHQSAPASFDFQTHGVSVIEAQPFGGQVTVHGSYVTIGPYILWTTGAVTLNSGSEQYAFPTFCRFQRSGTSLTLTSLKGVREAELAKMQ